MYKVVVVEDESMVRKGIILTIDWSCAGLCGGGRCGQRGRGRGAGGPPEAGHCGLRCENAPHGWGRNDRTTAETGVQSKIYHFDGLQRFQIRPECLRLASVTIC